MLVLSNASCGSEPTPAPETSVERAALGLGCSSDSECDDDKPCTLDVCVENVVCANLEILNCCLTDNECQTELGCLLSKCVAGACTEVEGCNESTSAGGTLSSTTDVGTTTSQGTGAETEGAGGGTTTTSSGPDGTTSTSTESTTAGGTSSSGGTGPGCTEDEQCIESECEIAVCLQGACVRAPDPLCCDLGQECLGIRCATGVCQEGRCQLDAACRDAVNGNTGNTGNTGSAGGGGAAGTRTASGAGGEAGNPNSAGAAGESGSVGGTFGGASVGAGTAGSGGTGATPPSYEVWGGGCSVTPSPGSGRPWLWLLLPLAVFGLRRRQSAGLLFVGVWIWPAGVRAQGSAFDEYPAPAAVDDLLWVERAAPRVGGFLPTARLAASYTKAPLIAKGSDGSEVGLIDQRLGLYASVGAAFADRFQTALTLPLYLQEGEALPGSPEAAETGLGDLGLDARAAILTRADPIELGVALTLQLPTGDTGALTGERTPSGRPRVILSKALDARGTLISGHLGSRVRGASDLGDVRLESELDAGVGALYMFTSTIGASAELGVRTSYRNFLEEQETPASVTGGVRYQRGWFVFHVGGGAGLSSGVGTPEFRLLGMGGLTAPGEALDDDTDGDGVPDASDLCKGAPEDTDGVEDQDGCPDLDNDADGVPDASDKCLGAAEDQDGFEDQDGCPESDNDQDGLSDALDKCPNDPEDQDGFEDQDGCPDADNDADSVADVDDACPGEAEDQDGFEDQDGCPETDNDKDGLLDQNDQCPKEPETQNGVEDQDGCPDFIRVEQGQIRTLEPVFFEFGKARIQRRSEPMLAEMARTISARPDLGRISVDGHTDDRGAAATNQRLSEQRARAVLDFLVLAGVPSERLTSQGFGESQPLTSNQTDAGRSKNRRVEFRFLIPEAPAPAEPAP